MNTQKSAQPRRLIAAWTLVSLVAPASFAAAPSPSPSPTAAQAAAPTGAPMDYRTLSHRIRIDLLRAGSHDESGTNDYFFTVAMFALINSAEERNTPFEARKKIPLDLGAFGDTQVDSLDAWKPDEKLKNYKEHKIDGNTIRELAARAMTEFKVPESDISVMTEIVMYEKGKKFFFFGDDTLVAKTSYFPIPPTKFDAPLRANQVLTMTDDKGTLVKLSVEY